VNNKLKNYTSDVPVLRSLAEIDGLLIAAGVSNISKEFAPSPPGKVAAVRFTILFPGQKAVTIRLPANEEGALNVLWRDYVGTEKLSADGQSVQRYDMRRFSKTKGDFKEQAGRVAWRIIKDWLAIELSRMRMQEADVREVFLSYVWDGKQTLFERIKADNFLALGPGKDHP